MYLHQYSDVIMTLLVSQITGVSIERFVHAEIKENINM